MNVKQADKDYGRYLKVGDLENALAVFRDRKGNFMYNLNETVYVDVPARYLKEYVVSYRSHWPLISYNIYSTTRLAWLLTKINGVADDDMFRALEPGEKVMYIDMDMVQQVINRMNGA